MSMVDNVTRFYEVVLVHPANLLNPTNIAKAPGQWDVAFAKGGLLSSNLLIVACPVTKTMTDPDQNIKFFVVFSSQNLSMGTSTPANPTNIKSYRQVYESGTSYNAGNQWYANPFLYFTNMFANLQDGWTPIG